MREIFPLTYNPEPMVLGSTPSHRLYDLTGDQLDETATSLQEEGEKALLQGDRKGLELLEQAAELDPRSHQLFYRQGLALFEYGTQKNCTATLRRGIQKFKQATDLHPLYCEAWHAWASTLVFLATLSGNPSHLYEARAKIENAAPLAPKELASEVYWDAALIYQKLAKVSGELDDLYKSIQFFEKSVAAGDTTLFEFWNDFGHTCAQLSEKVQDIHPTVKAIACYKQAISLTLANFEGWLGLARSLQKLYLFSGENEHYVQASDCFAAACGLQQDNGRVWLERISFMIEAGRRKKESGKIRAALEKCQQAITCLSPPVKTLPLEDLKTSVDPDKWSQKKFSTEHLYIQAAWAEALALLGSWNSSIELIQEAESKIEWVLDQFEDDDPFILNQSGKCLYHFAKYYQDLDLYYQAIEEFQSSISIDRSDWTSWVWMGIVHAEVYECAEDIGALEKALYFYSRASKIKTDPNLYYEIAASMILLGDANHNPELIERALSYLDYLFQAYKPIAFEHPEWFYQYGIALDIQGDYKDDASLHHKALDAFVNALMLNPNFPKIHHRIGIVYSHLGDSLGEIDYLYRAQHHFKLAARTQLDDELLLIDCGLAWIHLALHATDPAMEENCFREAEQKLIQAAKLGNQSVYYQLACLYSLQGSYNHSIFYLEKCFDTKNLPPKDELLDDEWLDGVRLSPLFQEFLALLPEN